MKSIGIISDTHGYIDDRIVHHLEKCDEIWHAGDIGTISVIEKLERIATVRAVYGNIDGGLLRKTFPLNQIFSCEEVGVCMTHIAGRPGKYPPRVDQLLRQTKPRLFICGHSHICLVKQNPKFGMLHLNPGAAGRHGFHKMRTLIRLKIEGENISGLEVVELGSRASAQ